MIEYLRKEIIHEPKTGRTVMEGQSIMTITEKKEMLPYEVEALKLLKEALIQLPPLLLPKEWQNTDYLRILSYCDFQIQASVQVLKEHLNWRQTVDIYKPPNELIYNGTIYINGHDKYYYPILIINGELATKSTLKLFEEALNFIVCLLIKDVLVPYYIDEIIVIVDCRTVKWNSNLVNEEFLCFLKRVEKNYFGRFHKIYLIIDEIEENLLQLKRETKNRLVLLNNTNLLTLQNQIHPNMVEIRFQGEQQNIKTNFWPPKDQRKEGVSLLQIDESHKSQYLQSNQKYDCTSSKLLLQVHNEEQEIILSESHLVEVPDSMNDLLDYCSSPKSHCFQSSHKMLISDSQPLQSTTMKKKDINFVAQPSWRSSEYGGSSDLVIQQFAGKQCCKESSCMLI